MQSILVTGYKHTDLGIFSDKDPRIPIIKKVIERDCIKMIEEGAQWFVFTGNLGFEFWALEVVEDLKQQGYDIQTAVIFPFANHGEQWNEANQVKLSRFKQSDFVKSAYSHYENPGQFREYNQFLLDSTDGVYLFYDSENETNLKYLHKLILKKEGYNRKTLTFDDLNEIAGNFEEND